MSTIAKRFIEKAEALMPGQPDLVDLDPTINNAQHIDEVMFRRSEYIGGMAAVILVLIGEERST